MYNRPYAHTEHQNFAYNTARFPHHSYHPYHASSGQVLHQTPYEQFAKPKQPPFWPNYIPTSFAAYQADTSMNTATNPMEEPQQKGEQVDFDKMLSTVSQLANTYHQVSPIVKEFGSIIKAFR
ncbi:hypothetical protein KFZ56_04555 [Virgibacillus sp. NKC19-3]|uniref:YppG family protein n=1 Tax=Virgibacillus saliphilus TaxID=2831674 RepID=UPI001C9B5FAB|nr:YppG family protein [Virgibacillus sp. NKC19-3]MBY7142376.1 hypothetical protein [Virgibacillus sp. NKC19-3]